MVSLARSFWRPSGRLGAADARDKKRPFWQRLSHILISLADRSPQDLQGCVYIVFTMVNGLRAPQNLLCTALAGGRNIEFQRGMLTLDWRILTISLGTVRSLFSGGRPNPPSYRTVVFYEGKLPPGPAHLMCYDTFCGPVSWPQGDLTRQVTEMS